MVGMTCISSLCHSNSFTALELITISCGPGPMRCRTWTAKSWSSYTFTTMFVSSRRTALRLFLSTRRVMRVPV